MEASSTRPIPALPASVNTCWPLVASPSRERNRSETSIARSPHAREAWPHVECCLPGPQRRSELREHAPARADRSTRRLRARCRRRWRAGVSEHVQRPNLHEPRAAASRRGGTPVAFALVGWVLRPRRARRSRTGDRSNVAVSSRLSNAGAADASGRGRHLPRLACPDARGATAAPLELSSTARSLRTRHRSETRDDGRRRACGRRCVRHHPWRQRRRRVAICGRPAVG